MAVRNYIKHILGAVRSPRQMELQWIVLVIILVSSTVTASSAPDKEVASKTASSSSAILDLVIVVDSSVSGYKEEPLAWTEVKDFIKGFTQNFTISPSDTQIGFAVFKTSLPSSQKHNYRKDRFDRFVYFTDFYKPLELKYRIDNLADLTSPGQSITTALRVVHEKILDVSAFDRSDVPNVVVVVITDGVNYNDLKKQNEEASKLKKEAIVAVIDVSDDSKNVQITDLEQIASNKNLIIHAHGEPVEWMEKTLLEKIYEELDARGLVVTQLSTPSNTSWIWGPN